MHIFLSVYLTIRFYICVFINLLMQLKLIKQNAFELKELKNLLQLRKNQIEKNLSIVNERLDLLTDIIEKNDKIDQHWVVILPASFLETNENSLPIKHNWKKIAMKLINKYDMPMTSEFMYNKAINQIEGLPDNRRVVLKNFSSALFYLAEKDEVLVRKKLSGRKEYLYAMRHHVNNQGKFIQEYVEKFKNAYATM
jgi:hypothetical protein